MPGRASHTLEFNEEKRFSHGLEESLALVDVETYPAFVGRNVDRLDLMAHLANQMQALTILSWKAPDEARRLRLLLTENDHLVDQISQANPAQVASGNLRTYGQIALVTHDHLFDCAKHRTHDILHAAPRSRLTRPQLLHVQPGVYSISIYYQTPFHDRHFPASEPGEEVDYTVIMRHYPFPPPRVAPVRLTGGFIPRVGDELAQQAWAHVTSHKAPGAGIPKMSA